MLRNRLAHFGIFLCLMPFVLQAMHNANLGDKTHASDGPGDHPPPETEASSPSAQGDRDLIHLQAAIRSIFMTIGGEIRQPRHSGRTQIQGPAAFVQLTGRANYTDLQRQVGHGHRSCRQIRQSERPHNRIAIAGIFS